MKYTDMIFKNDSVRSMQVEETVWGFYNPSESRTLFHDALSHWIFELCSKFDNVGNLVDFCLDNLINGQGVNSDIIFQNIAERLELLQNFGALRFEKSVTENVVLLIDPPTSINMVAAKGPSKGLCYLSLALEKQGLMPAKILDMRSVSAEFDENPAKWTAYFSKYAHKLNPKVVGITAVSPTIKNALFIGRLARMMFPEAFIVIGGPHASFEWKELLNNNECLNAVLIGEGEIVFPKIVKAVLDKCIDDTVLSNIKGVAWKNANCEVVSTGWSERIENLDDWGYPDDRKDLLNAKDYKISFPRIISSRGCSFSCSFCSTSAFNGKKFRERSIENVFDEIMFYWKKYDIEGFSFNDDIFTFKKERVLKLCNLLETSEMHGKLQWGCNTRIDCIDEQLIDAMYKAGCRTIFFGIETVNLNTLQQYCSNKMGIDSILTKLIYITQKGIECQLSFILGLPGDSLESIDTLIEVIQKMPELNYNFCFLNIFPGTPLAEKMDELGISYVSQNEEDKFNIAQPTVNSQSMMPEDQVMAYLKLRWSQIKANKNKFEVYS